MPPAVSAAAARPALQPCTEAAATADAGTADAMCPFARRLRAPQDTSSDSVRGTGADQTGVDTQTRQDAAAVQADAPNAGLLIWLLSLLPGTAVAARGAMPGAAGSRDAVPVADPNAAAALAAPPTQAMPGLASGAALLLKAAITGRAEAPAVSGDAKAVADAPAQLKSRPGADAAADANGVGLPDAATPQSLLDQPVPANAKSDAKPDAKILNLAAAGAALQATAKLDQCAAPAGPTDAGPLLNPAVHPLVPPASAATAVNGGAPALAADASISPLNPADALVLADDRLADTLKQRVAWLIDDSGPDPVQEARIALHPRELGHIEVRVRLAGDGAEVVFSAQHPAARSALESSLPRLRELFAADGLSLAQAQVGSQFQQQASQSRPQSQPAHPDSPAAPAEEAVAARRPRLIRVGLLDDYA
jgi:flagellar hook-length control protein FliK